MIRDLARRALPLTVYCQDDPEFPDGLEGVIDDRALEHSFRLGVEIVPTLLHMQSGCEVSRATGWDRAEWEALTGLDGLGAELPSSRPGCGSLSVAPGMREALAVRFGEIVFQSRKLDVPGHDDVVEACFDQGWSDGLPVVPPTEVRVARMLAATQREAVEVIGAVPPSLAACTVEKVAINAVLAGCKPEYFPVVLAAVEAALEPAFCMHGVLCTTCFSGPIVIVNGPVARGIGMNAGANALGQGNRANATIGRALQLVIRNIGGGVPGGIDRSTLGQPGKYTFCFAEDESDPGWGSLAVDRGYRSEASTVTLFAGAGVQGVWDENSRTPEALVRSLAASLKVAGNPNYPHYHDAILVVSPEHYRVFREAGWSRAAVIAALVPALVPSGDEVPEAPGKEGLSRYRGGGLHIVRAGGPAGLMSAILIGWGADSDPVTKEIGR